MKRNKKLTVVALSVMLVMALATTVISFTLANLNDKRSNDATGEVITLAESTGTLTNIDYIIKASLEENAEPYKIVEIGSVDKSSSDFGSFATDGRFKDYVIDGNRTIDDLMKAGMIEYTYLYAGQVTDTNDTALATVASADFIYVSAEKPYVAGSNDLGESLYNILHVAAVGDYKPFIIDIPESAGTSSPIGGSTSSKLVFNSMISDYFIKMGAKSYKAYYWNDTSMTGADDVAKATKFYKAAIGSGSNYVGINGRNRQTNWTNIKLTADAADQYKMAEVLVISSGGTALTSGAMFNKLTAGKSAAVTTVYEVGADSASTAITLGANQAVYGIANTPLQLNGYNPRYAIDPDYIRATEITLDQLATEEYASHDFTQYDMVIFEDDCDSKEISDALYKKLVGVMYSGVQIVYNYSLGGASSGDGGTDGEATVDEKSNYYELYMICATSDNVARYANIMVTDAAKLDIIMSSNSVATCKVIADLINSASFRGIGGPGSASTMFTVLEIQPCYPIDTVIAEAKGQYYSKPSEVLSKTREQLGIEATLDANGMVVTDASLVTDDTTEYYAWELSEAKVADMLNMDAKQVKVVHMSSEELAGSKDSILGNYDMVYIGGNTTAFKSLDERRGFPFYDIGNFSRASNVQYAPVYVMYANTGDMVQSAMEIEQGPVPSGELVTTPDGKTSADMFVTLNGNDISYVAYDMLLDYIDSGMPVIISNDVTNTYDLMGALENPYLQNVIDPNSFVYKFLQACDASTKGNVLWGFDPDYTELVDNDGGRLGDTATGTVEVFKRSYKFDEAQNKYVLDDKDKKIPTMTYADGTEVVGKDHLYEFYTLGNKRAKLAVTNMPAVYNVYDPSSKTYIGASEKPKLKFEFDVSGFSGSYTVYLYTDYDKNSIFDTSERIYKNSNVTSVEMDLSSVTGKYDANYSGPVFWKLEIVDDATGAAVSTQNLCYIEKGNPPAGEINVLQILPDEAVAEAYEDNGWVSLIFCTECQRALEILDRNPGLTDGYFGDGSVANLYDGKIGEAALNNDGTDKDHGVYTGKHQHRFGVVKYDSATALDDWYYNFADDVSDMYDVSIDIMTSRDFEKATDEVQTGLDEICLANYGVTFANMKDADLEQLGSILSTQLNAAASQYDAYITLEDYIYKKYGEVSFESLNPTTMMAELQGDNYALALAEYNLKYFIYTIKDDPAAPENVRTTLNNIYNTGMYSDMIIVYDGNNDSAYFHFDEYATYYEIYARALDKKLELKEEYDKANRLANYDNWLLGCYQCLIIGPAESFCGDDIETEAALSVLEGYVSGGGHTLMFHDTLSKYKDTGSHKLAQVLFDYYGMDKFHAEEDTGVLSPNGVDITAPVNTLLDRNNANIRIYQSADSNAYTEYRNFGLQSWYDVINFSFTIGDQNSGKVDTTGSKAVTGEADVKFNITVTSGGAPYSGELTLQINNGEKQTVNVKDGKVTVTAKNYTTAEVTTHYTTDDVWYLPYKLKNGYSAEKYLLPNLSAKDVTDDSRYFTFASDMAKVWTLNGLNKRYYTPLYAYTDSVKLSDTGTSADKRSPYKYATVDWKVVTANGYQKDVSNVNLGSDKASKTNDGMVTLFPFSLSDELNIAPTHAQAFAIDLNNPSVSVWYTIAGGDGYKAGSEMQAATPHDGTDNYFIYSIGNLYYCGAGHTKVTGPNKDNNDERMLYINVICNSVTNAAASEINAYDYASTDESKTNNLVEKVGSEYVLKLDESVTRPSFSFEYTLPAGKSARDIKVYYNLDGLDGYDESKDVLIREYTPKEAPQGTLIYVPENLESGEDFENLYIDPTYLTNGKYVYIMIQVTDSKGKVTYQKIKVVYKDKLYNLT